MEKEGKGQVAVGEIMQGHVLNVLKGMAAESVDCIITSPPYWGLRDYKLEPQVWDVALNENCQHEWREIFKPPQGGKNLPDNPPNTGADRSTQETDIRGKGTYSQFCSLCGAWRGSLGLEPTYQLYLQHLIQVFDELKRVLKPTGCLFVNLGDSYAGSNQGHGTIGLTPKQASNKGSLAFIDNPPLRAHGIPAKSLVGIPERFAIAMTDAGWIRRGTIIWHKPNCMPQSAKDRFTVDFDPIYFFTKSGKYWFQQQLEAYTQSLERWGGDTKKTADNLQEGSPYMSAHRERKMRPNDEGRNMRSVWRVPSQPFSGAHFATFPEALVEPMVRAGCPHGGLVLDPFMGSGTVAVVAERLNRQWVGIELNPAYIEMAYRRLRGCRKNYAIFEAEVVRDL